MFQFHMFFTGKMTCEIFVLSVTGFDSLKPQDDPHQRLSKRQQLQTT